MRKMIQGISSAYMGGYMNNYVKVNHDSYDALCGEYDDRAKIGSPP